MKQFILNMIRKKRSRPSRPVVAALLISGLIALLISIGLSISFGAVEIDLMTVWTAVFQFNPDVTSQQILMN